MHKVVWQNAESLNDNYVVYNEVYQKYCFEKQQLLSAKLLRVSTRLCNHQAYKICERRLVYNFSYRCMDKEILNSQF